MKYVTLTEGRSESVILRSRFLGFAYGVNDETDVLERLKELRKLYHDATHVCYAAIWDEKGTLSRFSDDGEPSGTAGAQIMGAIKSADLKKCLVAVVRYFGGTKLGTGGLTKAYASVAADCIANARLVTYVMSDIYRCNTDFSTFKKISNVVGIDDVSYSNDVSFTYSCPTNESIAPLIDKVNGKINYSLFKQDYKIVKN